MKKVGELKLDNAEQININATQKEIANLMREKNSRHVFVCNRGKLLGVISVSDILSKAIAEGKTLTALELMTKNPFFIDSDCSSAKALKQMLKQNQYSLPVVKDDKLIGTLNLTTCLGGLNERS